MDNKRYRIVWKSVKRKNGEITVIDNVRIATRKNNRYVDEQGQLIGFPASARIYEIK